MPSGFTYFHHARGSRGRVAAKLAADTKAVASVLTDAVDVSSGTAGVVTWAGTWKGRRVQVRTIVDTLATRKLPALWLSVTVTGKVAVPGVFDMMMRPGSATTFSNFDHLPHTLRTPDNFPDEAVIRTDRDSSRFPMDIIARHLGVFADGRAKELLITPNGARIVWLMAEADRARYGVFRQAEFGGAELDPRLIERLLGHASELCASLESTSHQVAA